MARKGRGHLSSIDLLPDEAQPDIQWALAELKSRDRLQKEIHEEFNSRLADRGLGPISASAFNRHSIKLAGIARRMEETREITSVLTERLEPGDTDNLTIMVAETIKTLVFEMLTDGGEAGFNPKQAKEMAEALRAAASAQKVSSERLRSVESDLAVKVEAVTEKLGKEMGLGKERIAQLRRDFLGVKDEAS
jgi:hypothetical protein